VTGPAVVTSLPQAASAAAGTLVILVVAALAWWLLVKAGERQIGRVAKRLTGEEGPRGPERVQRVETLWSIGRTVGAVLIVAVVVLTVLALWGIPIGPLLALGSVAGIAVGFGAQSIVRDLLGGFFIVAENEYAIGDVVELAGVAGVVEQIRLRITVLRDLDGKVHYVPHGAIGVVSNLTQEFSRVVIDVGVAYEDDVDRALAAVDDEAAAMAAEDEWAGAFVEPPRVLGVNELAESAVVIRLVFTTTTTRRWEAKREFLRRVKKRLDAEGIEIPYPRRTVIVRDVTDRAGEASGERSAQA